MRRALLLALPLLLAACGTTPPRGELPPEADSVLSEREAAWQAHSAGLGPLEQWQLHGRLAVQRGGEGWSAGVDWYQLGATYRIALSGPMGQGGMRLEGDEEYVHFSDSEGYSSESHDPEALLQRELGWQMPINALRYWVRGLPDPRAEIVRQTLDGQGRLLELEQAGWRVLLPRYREVGAFDLPSKLLLFHPQGEIRLVVGEWQLEQPR